MNYKSSISHIIGNPYIAKSTEDGREESVEEHSYKAARVAEFNAPEMLKGTARLIALLHDAGKNCDKFYCHIKKEEDKQQFTISKQVDHSTAGGIIVTEIAYKKY